MNVVASIALLWTTIVLLPPMTRTTLGAAAAEASPGTPTRTTTTPSTRRQRQQRRRGDGGQRQSLFLDYGWKFRTGLTDWAAPNDPPPPTKEDADPGRRPLESDPDYDDSTWWTVQLPHDGLIVQGPSQEACRDGCSGRSFIPRHVLWYRNSFSLPTQWMNRGKDEDARHTTTTNHTTNHTSGSIVYMEFQGSFRNTTVWLNGEWVINHLCGYTPFRIPLDASRKDHTVAVFVDPDNGDGGSPSSGSGWWYEGGGLYRHVLLVKTGTVRVGRDSLFVTSSRTDPPHKTHKHKQQPPMNPPSATVTLELRAAVWRAKNTAVDAICCYFQVFHPEGWILGQTQWRRLPLLPPPRQAITTNESLVLPGAQQQDDESILVKDTYEVVNPQLWTSAEPNLYQVDFVVMKCGERRRHDNGKHNHDGDDDDDEELDRVSVNHGIRKIHFDPNDGFYLNDQRYKIRGFCDHDTFAVVGMALPDRINLFRVSTNSVLGDGYRTTACRHPFSETSFHSPPSVFLT